MKISTLSFLKPGQTAQIVSIIRNGTLSNHRVEKLYSVGICPGEKIAIQNRVKDLYIVKTEMFNPFCLREDVAKSIQIRTDKKPVSLMEQQLFIIESLPNIGPVNAKNLLTHFGSVSKVLNASESELQEVEGIGKKTAENIRKVVDSKYLYFEKEIKEKRLL